MCVFCRREYEKKDINEITEIQYKILNNCTKYLKKDGEIVYSTCSILKDENGKPVLGDAGHIRVINSINGFARTKYGGFVNITKITFKNG